VERGKEGEVAAEDAPLPPPPSGPRTSPSGSNPSPGIGGVANRYALPPSFSKSGPAPVGRASIAVAPRNAVATNPQVTAGLPMRSGQQSRSATSLSISEGGPGDAGSMQDVLASAGT
jgi:hypothetical protein